MDVVKEYLLAFAGPAELQRFEGLEIVEQGVEALGEVGGVAIGIRDSTHQVELVSQEATDHRPERAIRGTADRTGTILKGNVAEPGPRAGERIDVHVVGGVEEAQVGDPAPVRKALLPEQVGSSPSLITEYRVRKAHVADLTAKSARGHVGIGMPVLDLEDDAAVVYLAAVIQFPGAEHTEHSTCRGALTGAVDRGEAQRVVVDPEVESSALLDARLPFIKAGLGVDPEEVRLVFFIRGQLGCHGVGGHQLACCILGMKPGNDCGDDQQHGGTGNAKLHYLVGQR